MRKCFSFFCCLLWAFSAWSQVEIFRNTQDTSTYIRPEDTITKPPVFGAGDHDFFRYIETKFMFRPNSGALDYQGENIRFSFYVGKDGKVSDFEMLYGSNAIVAAEIERIVTNMPEWEPGYLNGKKKKTLMIYNLLIRRVDDLPPVQVTLNESTLEYTDQTKQLKWFIIGGSVLVLATLWITSFLK